MCSYMRTLLLLNLLLLSSAAPGLASWQPPAGIPKPSFGVDEVRPGTPTLVVQNGQAIPNPVPAGAVVEIRGTYSRTHEGGSRLQCAGTASQPAFIYGATGATVTGSWEIVGSYCIIESLKFSGQGWTFLAPGDHLVLRDSEVVGTSNSGGFAVQSWDSATLRDVVMLRNNIHHNGNVNATYDQDVHGTGFYRSSGSSGSIHHVWILDSEYSYCSGDGIQINANNDSSKVHHIYIGRVTSHHNKQGGIWSKRASDVVLSQNTVYAHRAGNSSLGHCVGYQYGPERIWFLFNHLYDCERGIMSASDLGGADGTEAYAIGNLIHDIVADRNGGSAYTNSGIMISGSQRWTIANNTFWNVPVGVASPNNGGEIRVEGNIFGPFNLTAGSALFFENSSRPYSVTGNVFKKALFRLGGFSSTYGISRLPGNKETDPQLVSPPDDFRLLESSPAIDYSPLSTAYERFEQLYGIPIKVDHDGVSRPLGNAIDAGAFEGAGQAWRFADVPPSSPFYLYIETLVENGVTSGCSTNPSLYCPTASVTRAQMSVFLLRSSGGAAYYPPRCTTSIFTDVPCSNPFASWVNELAELGVTAGCGSGRYCPATAVNRGQMAVFLLRTLEGSGYRPPACTTSIFTDVPCSSPWATWVNELVARGVTAGCGGGKYCPDTAVQRDQMAVFLVRAFMNP